LWPFPAYSESYHKAGRATLQDILRSKPMQTGELIVVWAVVVAIVLVVLVVVLT
jgi:hypothetical protein